MNDDLCAPCFCPKCGYFLDAAASAEGRDIRPVEGDWSLCINCAALLCFKADLTMRMATTEEIAMMSKEDREFLGGLLARWHETADRKPKADFGLMN